MQLQRLDEKLILPLCLSQSVHLCLSLLVCLSFVFSSSVFIYIV